MKDSFIKVVFIAAANSIHTVKWVNALYEKGCQVTLISLKNHKNTEKNIHEKVKIIYLPISGVKGYYLNRIFINYIIEKQNPDIINVHYASGYGTLGRFIHRKNKLLNVWGSDVYDFPNQNSFNRRALIKNLNSYKAIASTSICMAKEIKKYTDKMIYITPFGVDSSLFKKIEKEREKDKFIIGTVKALKKIYGIEYLIKAIYELKKIISSDMYKKIEVHIYGEGDMEQNLKELSQKLGLGDKIKFLGYIPNSKVPRAISMMDIFTVTSEKESFGVAAVEAMSCAVPVIVSDAEGLEEIVSEGNVGFVVPKRNEKSIAEKMKLLLENQDLRKEMGANGRKKVLRFYEWNANVELMLLIYKGVIDGSIERKKYKYI